MYFSLSLQLFTIVQLINYKMSEMQNCPKCGLDNTYFDGSLNVCPDCFYEWAEGDIAESETNNTPKDSNGTELADGDDVTVIKDLNVRGSSMVIKRGTKVKNIRLTDDPDEVDCKINGSGIVLKTCFLKKN